MYFCAWLLSLIVMISRFIRGVSSFLWPYSISLCVCVCIYEYFLHFHLSIDKHLSWFHILTNRIQVSLYYIDFGPFGYIPRTGIPKLYDSSVFIHFLRNRHTFHYNGYTNLQSPPPHSSFVCLMTVILPWTCLTGFTLPLCDRQQRNCKCKLILSPSLTGEWFLNFITIFKVC